MNSPSLDCNNPGNKKHSSQMMHFGKHQVHHWAVYLALLTITAILFVLINTLDTTFHGKPHSRSVSVRNLKKPTLVKANHKATDKLIEELKQYGLWEIDPSRKVPRFFIKNYPADLHTVKDVSRKKRVFLHALLPHALLVRDEALRKRHRLQSILGKINCSPEDIYFDIGLEFENQCSWSDFLAEDEEQFIYNLSRNYRAMTAEDLLERVDAVPTSIILAQGALESSWGSSRFTREGNSIFGMWTWKTKGIVPTRRDEGKKHKVKIYDDVLDSVQAYHLTLNRLASYEQFRQFRKRTDDPLIMAEGLIPYSERGEEYVDEIKKIILSNDLQKYDRFDLSDLDLQNLSSSVSKADVQVKSGKASP
jgi:Bax protein